MILSQKAYLGSFFLLSLLVFALGNQAEGQRARFDDFFALQNPPQTGVVPQPPPRLNFPGTIVPPASTVPSLPGPAAGRPPVGGPIFGQGFPGQLPPSGAIVPQSGFGLPPLGQGIAPPAFDPYSTTVQPFPVFPRAQPQIQAPPVRPRIQAPPTRPPSALGQPGLGFGVPQNLQPQLFQGPNPGFNFNPAGVPPSGGFGLPNRFPFQGTGTNWLPSIDWSFANNAWNSFRNDFLPRVLERPRVRQTWIHGSTGGAGIGNELNINDLELATTATWPRFLGGSQPLRISPGFIFHWWNGPNTDATGADLPSQAYSAYLAFDHTTDPSRGFGFDNNLTVGYFSDFDNTSSDALRVTGRLVGWRRINEYMVGKLGVEYLDRIRLKLLPVVGIYANPHPDMKIDLAFPRSKISHRIPNFNNFEGWAYVGGEYGGGSWAIERPVAGFEDQVDINDVRAYLGLEWIGPRRVTGFVEFGYVFERELVYRSDPINDVPLQDSLMLRSGFAF